MDHRKFATVFPLGSHLCREPMPPMAELKRDMEKLVSLCPQLRVLYMSGYADENVVAQNRVSIESAFLRKPFVIGDLVSKVQEMLNVPAQ